jgi:hypothetical protein
MDNDDGQCVIVRAHPGELKNWSGISSDASCRGTCKNPYLIPINFIQGRSLQFDPMFADRTGNCTIHMSRPRLILENSPGVYF